MLSIIITLHSNACYLAEAVESALHQSYQSREIIIIDGSSDDIGETVLAPYRDAVTIIKHPVNPIANEFRAILRNIGIRTAKGSHFVFLDDDDILHPDMLSDAKQYLNTNPYMGMVYTNLEFIDSRGLFLERGENVYNFIEGTIFEQLLLKNCIPVHTALVPRTTIEKAGLFDESLPAANDWDLWIRIAKYFSIAHLPQVRAYYRIHANSFHLNKMKMLSGDIALAKKYLSMPSDFQLNKKEKRILNSSIWYSKAKIEYMNNKIFSAIATALVSLAIYPERLIKFVFSRRLAKREKLASLVRTIENHA